MVFRNQDTLLGYLLLSGWWFSQTFSVAKAREYMCACTHVYSCFCAHYFSLYRKLWVLTDTSNSMSQSSNTCLGLAFCSYLKLSILAVRNITPIALEYPVPVLPTNPQKPSSSSLGCDTCVRSHPCTDASFIQRGFTPNPSLHWATLLCRRPSHLLGCKLFFGPLLFPPLLSSTY